MLKELYYMIPEHVKKIIKKAYSEVPFQYVYGSKFCKYYKWLMKTQWLTREELEEIQNLRLRAIIKHTYHNVPYYRRIFEVLGLKPSDIQTKEDLKLLPVLTKNDIRKHFDNLIAKTIRNINQHFDTRAVLPENL
ncbi:MAG: hypothetical protein Q6351_008175 [Candidatus Njordarchaeum guaymaensis]